jgi:hypothetical protein
MPCSRQQLRDTQHQLMKEAEAREKLEENMKQAFMRGRALGYHCRIVAGCRLEGGGLLGPAMASRPWDRPTTPWRDGLC